MDALKLRFPHLSEQIFQKLDNESLFKSREVARSWVNLIDGRNYSWLRIVNSPTILDKRNTYLHLAAETGQFEAFKTAFGEEEDKNVKNERGETQFHRVCENGRFKIAQLLLKHNDLEFNVNAEDDFGNTAVSLACYKGHSDVVKILIENAAELRIDLNAKNPYGLTAFHFACLGNNSNVVKVLIENAATYGIDLNIRDNYGMTAFNIACQRGHSDVVKILKENSAFLKIELPAFLKIELLAKIKF